MRTATTRNASCLILALLAVTPALGQSTETPLDAFQRAVALEEQAGKTAEALARYQALAAAKGTPYGLRGRALYRSGVCLERLGRNDDARAAYGKLVQAYPKLTALVRKARAGVARLARLQQEPKAAVPTITVELESSITAAGNGTISIEANNTDVRDLIKGIAEFGKLNFVISPEVAGSVTLSVKRIEPLAALRLLAVTVNNFAVAYDPARRFVRFAARRSFELDLTTRVYPLKRIKVEPIAQAARAGLLRTVRELITSQRVRGSVSVYDRRSASLIVSHSPLGHEAVQRVLGQALRPAPAPLAAGPTVSVEFSDANVRTVLKLLAATAKVPLLVAPTVSGNVSMRLENVSAAFAIQQVARTCGDYVAVETPAATVVLSRSAVETWLVTERWPLAVEPRSFWTLEEALPVTKDRRLSAHPLQASLSELIVNSGVPGTAVGLDVGGHALILQVTLTQRAELRAALIRLGYLALAATRKPAKHLVKLEDVEVRTALAQAAAVAKVNVVVSPEVRGRITGTYRADAPTQDVFETLLRSSGDYAVALQGEALFRATTRVAFEADLHTARIVLQRRSAASATSLHRALNDAVVSSHVRGSLAVLDPANKAFVLSLPRNMLATFSALIRASDQPGVEPKLEGLFVPVVYEPNATQPILAAHWIVQGRLVATGTHWEDKHGDLFPNRGEERVRFVYQGTGPNRIATIESWTGVNGPRTKRQVVFPRSAFRRATPSGGGRRVSGRRKPRKVRTVR